MLDELKKTIDKGLEFATMTRDKIAQAAKDIAKENKLNKEEAKKLLDHLLKKSDEARKSLETDFLQLVQTTLEKMKVPTQKEIKLLEGRIKKLESFHKTAAKAKAAPKGATNAKGTSRKATP